MQKYRMWVLTLGILSMTPGITAAGLPQLFKAKNQKSTRTQARISNQQTAERVAEALRSAKLAGYDISIEFRNGVATLSGQVADSQQREKATRYVAAVRGVNRVENRLSLIPRSNVTRPAARRQPTVAQADYRLSPADQAQRAETIQQVSGSAPRRPNADLAPENQQMAERIAAALGRAALTGYDIEIVFQDGAAMLAGAVATPQERSMVTQIVTAVPGVQFVDNRLTLLNGRQQPHMAGAAIRPVAYQNAGAPPVPPAVNAPMAGQPNIPAPPSYGHPGSGQSHMAYDMPHLPEYAWPAYASYPNYAQVTYPKEYAASAWPYIGPFYPYPQIPLGWRQVQLEWDDGHWNLNFRPRTDRWWWFLDPENW